MNILYIGDVMGETGVRLLEELLPGLRHEKSVDVVIAQAENVTNGKGMSVADYRRLRRAGVDGFTGGNHTTVLDELYPLLSDPAVPVTCPANMPDCPGPSFKYVGPADRRVLIVSILGQIVGKDAARPVTHPLHTVDSILESQKNEPHAATIINFHGDYSSEKVVFGYYLDGRVTAVIGDHWHVPTADAMVLPKGTAHQTDVGMCGSIDSSLGVKLEIVIDRWKNGILNRNELETTGRRQFNALLVRADDASGLARSVEAINLVL